MKRVFSGFFLGCSKFTVKTASYATLLNRLKQFSVFKVWLNEEGFSFCCLLKNEPMVRGIMLGQNYTIERSKSIFDLFAFLKYRITIFVCLLGCIVTSIVFRDSTLVIKITGVHGAEYAQIYSYVQENRNVGLKQLELGVINGFDYVSLASCQVIGNTLTVNIKQRAIITVDVSPTSVLARYSGVVSKIVVVAGTPLVKVGSPVAAGAVLIANYEIKDDAVKSEIKAIGEVWATVYITKSIAKHTEDALQYRDEALMNARRELFEHEVAVSEKVFVNDFGNGYFVIEAVVEVLRKIS